MLNNFFIYSFTITIVVIGKKVFNSVNISFFHFAFIFKIVV